MACAVNGCKNLKRFKPKGVTFYRFPTGSLLNEWLRVLDKGSKWQWTNKLICSEHFSQNDIIKTGVKTIYL
ncbi:THAP domain [Popillia japonica]|uniref:THAP domain n=1 Tax=Popillia japonica TaxID=7064 RepID=A0AAW1MZ70_POPJA